MSAAITAAVIAAGGAAYAANRQSKAAKEARQQQNAPWSETTTRTPWDEAMPYLSGALGENQRIYQQTLQQYANATRRSGRGGAPQLQQISGAGKGGGYSGASNKLLARMNDRAMNRSPLLDQAGDYVSQALTGGEGGPFANQIYNELYGMFGGGSEGGFGFMMDPANDPTMAPYIEALRREMNESRDQQLAEIDDRANAIGMYGGSGRALEAARTREEADEALGAQIAGLYMQARQGNLDRLMNLGAELTGERQYGVEAAMGLHDQEMGDLGNVFGIYEQRNRAAAAARERAIERQISEQRHNQSLARRDALMPMNIFGDYLKGLGVLTDLGPSTVSTTGQGQRGGGQYFDPGPGAAAAGISSLGGSLMSLYGAGAFDRQPRLQQQPVQPLPVPPRQAPAWRG